MRLFEIADSIERVLIDGTNADTGEISDAALTALDALEMERDAKALAVCAYLVGERAESDAIGVQADRLQQRAKIHANRAKRLEDYVAQHVEPGRKLSDARVAITWRKSKRVEIDAGAESKLPERFVRVRVEPDKTALREALAAGETVDGAKLVERLGMLVR